MPCGEERVSGVGRIGGSSQDNTPLRVHYKGNITWYPPLETTTSCEVKIAHYPFDTQTCVITLSSWAFTTSDVSLADE
ncbi:hypothetical protein ACOMHN_054716 [Nucella lapillus]